MKNTRLLLITSLSLVGFLSACSCSVNGNSYQDDERFEEKALNVYEEANSPSENKFNCRFYEKTPNIPYVNVKSYYSRFFAHDDYLLERDDFVYELSGNGGALRMDAKNNIFSYKNISAFSNHNKSIESNGKIFLKGSKTTKSGYVSKFIDLDDYHIDIHSDGSDVYVPLSFLSIFSGGSWMYNIAYNGKDIFVIDRQGILSDGVSRDYTYYGEKYTSPMKDYDTPRSEDVIKYNYGQLCLSFDHFRGYTSQLAYGDNNLLTLGANGILEEYYPKVKALLLSKDKKQYYAGYNLFMGGMYDGGHTASLMLSDSELGINSIVNNLSREEFAKEIDFFSSTFYQPMLLKNVYSLAFGTAKSKVFPYVPDTRSINPEAPAPVYNYYMYDETTKTSYIGFDSFATDNRAWDDFYNNNKTPDQAPVDTDSYAFIRSCFYKALDDKAENLVLDLSTNGGGNTSAGHYFPCV